MSYKKKMRQEQKKLPHAGFAQGTLTRPSAIAIPTAPDGSRRNTVKPETVQTSASGFTEKKQTATPTPKQPNTDRKQTDEHGYLKLRSAPDFEENSQYVSTANGKKPRRSSQGPLYVQTGFDDILYDYINQDPIAQKRQLNNDITLGTRHDKWRDLPENVIKTFNYLYTTRKPEEAYKYIETGPWNQVDETLPASPTQEPASSRQNGQDFRRKNSIADLQAQTQEELAQQREFWRLSSLDIPAAQEELDALRRTASELEQTYRSVGINIPTYGSGGISTFYGEKTSVGKQRDTIKKRQELIAAQIATLQSDIEKAQDLGRWQEYLSLQYAPDFEEKSRYQSTQIPGGPIYNPLGNIYTASGFDDATYDYINRNPDARSYALASNTTTGLSLLGLDESFLKEMTDEEVAIFNYLYANGKDDPEHQEAYDFVRFLTKNLNYRQRQNAEADWARRAKDDPVGASAFSILESPLKGLSYLGQAADYFADGKVDPNAGYNKFSYTSSAIRDQVAGDIEANVEGFWGKAGGFAYRTGMDMGDFLLSTAITGGDPALSLAIISTGSAADTTLALKDAGLDDNRAFFLGSVAGASEIIAEKVNVGTLLDQASLGRRSFQSFIGNVLTQGSKKVESDLITWTADWLYDCITEEENGEWSRMIQANIARGMSESDAISTACADRLLTLGQDFLSSSIVNLPGQTWNTYGP